MDSPAAPDQNSCQLNMGLQPCCWEQKNYPADLSSDSRPTDLGSHQVLGADCYAEGNRNGGAYAPQTLQSLHLSLLHPDTWKSLFPDSGLPNVCLLSSSKTKTNNQAVCCPSSVCPSKCNPCLSPGCCVPGSLTTMETPADSLALWILVGQ